MIKYLTSNGERVSEATIKARLTAAYRKRYSYEPLGACEGCGEPAVCTAHIVPKARCKSIHKTEYIWDSFNWFRACYKCNQTAENPSKVHTLMNYERILEVTKIIDPERYNKILWFTT